MAKKTLTFETGVAEYDINGKATARFNPTDAAFVERLYNAFTDLEKEQEAVQARVDEIGDDAGQMIEFARERDEAMRSTIDALLGEGVSDALFEDMNCYALADGMPAWVNLMFAVAEEVESSMSEERKKSDPRMRGYSQKYAQLTAKYSKKAR